MESLKELQQQYDDFQLPIEIAHQPNHNSSTTTTNNNNSSTGSSSGSSFAGNSFQFKTSMDGVTLAIGTTFRL